AVEAPRRDRPGAALLPARLALHPRAPGARRLALRAAHAQPVRALPRHREPRTGAALDPGGAGRGEPGDLRRRPALAPALAYRAGAVADGGCDRHLLARQRHGVRGAPLPHDDRTLPDPDGRAGLGGCVGPAETSGRELIRIRTPGVG